MSLFETISRATGPKESSGIFTKISNITSTPAVSKSNTLSGIYKNFFEPDGDRLRLRDVVRELPAAAKRVAETTGNVGREIFQGTARTGGSVGLSLLTPGRKLVGKKPIETLKAPDEINTFSDVFRNILFGDEDIESLGKRVEKFPSRISGFGDAVGLNIDPESKISKGLAVPAILGLTALDFTGGGGKDDVIKLLAKTRKSKEILAILKNQVKGIPDDIAPAIAKQLENISNPKIVDDIIKKEITLARNSQRFADARYVSSQSKGSFTNQIDGVIPGRTVKDIAESETDDIITGLEALKGDPTIGVQKFSEIEEIFEDIAKGKGILSSDKRRQARELLKLVDTQVERGFITTAKESPTVSPLVVKKIASNYNPTSNDVTLSAARKLINADLNAANRLAKDTTVSATAESNAVAQLLVQRAQNAKQWDEAIDLIEITAERATKQGQAIQALSIFNRLSPEGVLRFTQRTVNKANVGRKAGSKIKITPEFADDIVKQSNKIQKMPDGIKKAQETADMINKINGLVPASILLKISTFQILAQLLNPKTLIRNLGGNTAFAAVENITDVFGAAIDTPLSLITGKRSKALPSVWTQLKGFKTGLKQGVSDALAGVDTLGLPTRYDIPKTPVFTGKVGRSAEKTLNVVLRGPDRAAYKATYDGSIATQLNVATKNSGKLVTVPTDVMKEIAHYDGMYRTFQDQNVVSNAFVGLKKVLNLGLEFGLGDILIKYPRTPGNLIARGLDYSPAGFANATYEMARPLMGKTFNQKAFIESFSRAIVGTGSLVGMGALMHRLGILTGERQKDTDIAAVRRETGLGAYKINASALKRFTLSGMDPETAELQPGDVLYTYDWFQPLAVGISIGANIDETHAENERLGEDAQGVAGTLIENVASGLDTIGEQPLVQNLTRILKSGSLSDAGINTLKTVPRSFVPTLMSQVNQFADNRSRNTYDPDVVSEAFNAAKQRVPVLAGQLPPRISVFGEDMEVYQDASNNLFNVFFNPAFKSVYTPTPESELVLSLFEEIGETKQAPRVVQKTATVNGEKIKLSQKQITAMQRFVGTITRDRFHQLANNPQFQSMIPEDKVKFMSNELSDIGAAAKIIILGNRPDKVSAKIQSIMGNYLIGNTVLQEQIQSDIE